MTSRTKVAQIHNLLNDGFYTISVKYTSYEKTYVYKVHKSIQLQVGCYVIVPSSKDATQFYVVQVAEVHDSPRIDYSSNIDYKWIVGKVDFSMHNKLQAAEIKFRKLFKEIDLMKQREQALKELTEFMQTGPKSLETLKEEAMVVFNSVTDKTTVDSDEDFPATLQLQKE